MMSPTDKRLIQESFALVAPIADQAAALFYERLFTLDPSLRPLFTSDMSEQGRKLMQTLQVAVKGLDDLEALLPVLRTLAIRHVGYGVQDHHYATVGAALLWTLEQGLSEAFTPATREAWTTLYGVISGVMIEAAHESMGVPI